MLVSFTPHLLDTLQPQTVDMSWQDFCAAFDPSQWFQGPKKEAPMWSPASYAEGSRVNALNVKHLSSWVGDFDSDPERGIILGPRDLAALFDKIRRFECCALIHTSASHTRDAWRWRVVIPFAEPVALREWPRVWTNAAAYFAATGVDDKCKDASRRYWAPTMAPDAFFEVIHGSRFLHAKDLPDLGPAVGAVSHNENSSVRAASKAVARLIQSWKRSDPIDAEILRCLVDGEIYAERGKRHETLLPLTARLASVRWVAPEAFAELFARSLQRTAAVDGAQPEDIAGMVRTWRDKLDVKVDAQRNELISRAFGGRWSRRYAAEEIEVMREAQAGLGLTEVASLQDRWIVQHGADFYFLRPVLADDGNGGTKIVSSTYAGPYSADAPSHALQFLAAAEPEVLATTMSDGVVRAKAMPQLVREYGRAVDTVALSFADEHSHTRLLSGKTALVHAIGAIDPDLRPEFSNRVERLLQLQVEDEYVNDYMFWLGVCTRYEHPLKALYFNGPKGIAKSLVLNKALGRLHGQRKCTPGQSLLKRFNGAAIKHPIACWDDDADSAGDFGPPKKITTSQLRAWTSDPSRTIELKGREEMHVFGYLRFVFLTNGQEMIVADSIDDAQESAIAERVLYVRGSERAKDFLLSTDLISEDEIANHLLWLRQRYAAQPALGRFYLPERTQGSDQFARTLRVRFGGVSDFFECVVSALIGAEKIAGMSIRQGGHGPEVAMSRTAIETTYVRTGSKMRRTTFRERVMTFFKQAPDGASVLDLGYLRAYCDTTGQPWSTIVSVLAEASNTRGEKPLQIVRAL